MLALFAFFALLAARTGSWELGNLRHRAELAPLFWLALFGFGLKAGLFPLHIWLPSAHANAPSHVSAMLSGVTLKIGIYGLVRFSGWLPVPPQASWVVAFLGVTAYRTALARPEAKVGRQSEGMEESGVWLLPNPSGLNAHYRLEDLAELFAQLRAAVGGTRAAGL